MGLWSPILNGRQLTSVSFIASLVCRLFAFVMSAGPRVTRVIYSLIARPLSRLLDRRSGPPPNLTQLDLDDTAILPDMVDALKRANNLLSFDPQQIVLRDPSFLITTLKSFNLI